MLSIFRRLKRRPEATHTAEAKPTSPGKERAEFRRNPSKAKIKAARASKRFSTLTGHGCSDDIDPGELDLITAMRTGEITPSQALALRAKMRKKGNTP